ncbi:MAG: helix-turn-helix domain-containing protein [Solirubrobacterales bacterium]|nr:helix-turn-helix domain-containing protein [Solirubrobacterales bacterium]
MTVVPDDLAGCLRSWRGRLTPGQCDLPDRGPRRVAGLRREEVAHLARVSLDYLTRLEQGRATNPSPSMLAALASALQLTDAERSHLYSVAASASPDQAPSTATARTPRNAPSADPPRPR